MPNQDYLPCPVFQAVRIASQYLPSSSLTCPQWALFSNLTIVTVQPLLRAIAACSSTSSQPTILSARLYKYILGTDLSNACSSFISRHSTTILFSLLLITLTSNDPKRSRWTNKPPNHFQNNDFGSPAEMAA